MDEAQAAALEELGRLLTVAGYSFHTPAPTTHRTVLARTSAPHATTLGDVFGWNKPFEQSLLPLEMLGLLKQTRCIQSNADSRCRSLVRFSTLGSQLFAHSAFPTDSADAVFFGPDTYRFARAIVQCAERYPSFTPRRILDIGAGSGAGGLVCATLFPKITEIILSDINRAALRLATVNAALNAVDSARVVESDIMADIEGSFDFIIANPPYLVDRDARIYRHGGGTWGYALALRIVRESLPRLTPEGKLLLYTGTPVVEGSDQFLEAVRPMLDARMATYRYEEIDPDVFGEELANAPYDKADRIAAVVLSVDGRDVNDDAH